MSRSTPMERIEKLRQQLEEAEAKAAEQELKKQQAEQERNEKKRNVLTSKLQRLLTQQANINALIAETQAKLDELGVKPDEVQADVADDTAF